MLGRVIETGPLNIVLGRSAVAAVVLAVGLALAGTSIRLEPRSAGLMAAAGVVLAVHWLAFYHAIDLAGVAIGVIGYATYPAFVVALDAVVQRTRPRRVDWLAAGLVLAGLVFVAPSFELADLRSQGLAWAVLSGFTFAVLTLMNRTLVRRHRALKVSFYQLAVAAAVLLPVALTAGQFPGSTDLAWIVMLGLVCTALAQTLFVRCLMKVRPQTASVIAGLEPVYAIALAVWWLAEYPPWSSVAGATLIVLATFLVSREPL